MRKGITTLTTKHQGASKSEWKNNKKEISTNVEPTAGKGKDGQKKSYPPCQHCNKKGHPPFK